MVIFYGQSDDSDCLVSKLENGFNHFANATCTVFGAMTMGWWNGINTKKFWNENEERRNEKLEPDDKPEIYRMLDFGWMLCDQFALVQRNGIEFLIFNIVMLVDERVLSSGIDSARSILGGKTAECNNLKFSVRISHKYLYCGAISWYSLQLSFSPNTFPPVQTISPPHQKLFQFSLETNLKIHRQSTQQINLNEKLITMHHRIDRLLSACT